MTNLVESCGAEWFNNRVAGAWFLFNGEVLQVTRARNNTLDCCTTKGYEHKQIPCAVISGFKVFAYPKLGYRRDPDTGVVAFLTKKHSYARGLRTNSILHEVSPGYTVLKQRFEVIRNEGKLMTLVLKPTFDPIEDVHNVIAGQQFACVPNEDVLIEPSIHPEAEDVVVYFRERPAAHITPKGKIAWRTDAYKKLLSPLFKGVLQE